MMKKISFLLIVLYFLNAGCEKGIDYCQSPQEVNGFQPLEASYDPSSPINVELDFIFNYGQEIHETTTLFTFTVPGLFERPKGDDRPIDTVDQPEYTYVVEDTTNIPDSVNIEAYAFNDCGKSEVAKATIYFN